VHEAPLEHFGPPVIAVSLKAEQKKRNYNNFYTDCIFRFEKWLIDHHLHRWSCTTNIWSLLTSSV